MRYLFSWSSRLVTLIVLRVACTVGLTRGARVETRRATGSAVSMPRSIWNGMVTFGLIAVPIKVHSATDDKTVHFHQVHAPDGARIRQKRICSKEGREVPYKQVAKATKCVAASTSCSTRRRSTRQRASAHT